MATVFTRKIVALVLALAMLVGTTPIAAAASHPAPAMASMAMTGGTMPSDKSMPASERQLPCKDMQNCLGMLGCATPAALLQAATAAPIGFSAFESSWAPQRDSGGIALQPDHPPPIA